MIYVTKLNDDEIVINCDLIETIQALPDTTITLTTERKLIVKESVDKIIDKIIYYKKSLYNLTEKEIINYGNWHVNRINRRISPYFNLYFAKR